MRLGVPVLALLAYASGSAALAQTVPDTAATPRGRVHAGPGTLADTAASSVPGAGIPSVDTLAAPGRGSIDHRAFRFVYDYEGQAFSGTMREVNAASRPLFIAAVPASGVASLIAGADLDPTVRLAASELGAAGAVFALKFLVRRPRPYVALPGIVSRVAAPVRDHDPYSLPSGHAAVAFALATSTTLSYPRWYVGVPAYAWASATALARVWHGVHFPSDILLGATMGTGVAVLVHLVMPEFDSDVAESAAPAPPAATVRIPF